MVPFAQCQRATVPERQRTIKEKEARKAGPRHYLHTDDRGSESWQKGDVPLRVPKVKSVWRDSPRTGFAFSGAVSPQHVRQRVVAFVARVFVDAAGRSRHRQFTFPWRRERRRIVDFELVQQRVGVEETESLDQV